MVFQRLEYKMRLHINGETIDRRVMTVCVGNAPGYGQTPNAVPYNGMLDVSVVYHTEMVQARGRVVPLLAWQDTQPLQRAPLPYPRGRV